MSHNQDFVYATRDYSTRLRGCSKLTVTNPQKVIDICGTVRALLSADTRLKGHREYAGMVEQNVELLEELAKQRMYSPEH